MRSFHFEREPGILIPFLVVLLSLMALASPILTMLTIANVSPSPTIWRWISLAALSLFALTMSAIIALAVARRWVWNRRDHEVWMAKHQICEECGYELANLSNPRCPECSEPYTAVDEPDGR